MDLYRVLVTGQFSHSGLFLRMERESAWDVSGKSWHATVDEAKREAARQVIARAEQLLEQATRLIEGTEEIPMPPALPAGRMPNARSMWD